MEEGKGEYLKKRKRENGRNTNKFVPLFFVILVLVRVVVIEHGERSDGSEGGDGGGRLASPIKHKHKKSN